MIPRKNILGKIAFGLLAVSIASSLVGADMNSGRPPVEVGDVADGTPNHVLGWNGSGVAESQSRDGVRVFNVGNQTISNSTNTAIAFDSERFDDNSMHDTVTNNSRLVATIAGRYLIIGQIYFTGNATGFRTLRLQINGTTRIAEITEAPGTANDFLVDVTTVYNLAADDYVELIVHQTSGGNLNIIDYVNADNEFMMQRLRSE